MSPFVPPASGRTCSADTYRTTLARRGRSDSRRRFGHRRRAWGVPSDVLQVEDDVFEFRGGFLHVRLGPLLNRCLEPFDQLPDFLGVLGIGMRREPLALGDQVFTLGNDLFQLIRQIGVRAGFAGRSLLCAVSRRGVRTGEKGGDEI